MSKVKAYVISGHGAGDPGAVGCGREEAQMVRMLARRIKELGGDEVELAPPDRNSYNDSGLLNYAIPEGAQVVELHMDSAVEGARGGHVLVKEGYAPDAVDLALAALMGSVFPGRADTLRGVSWLKNANQAAVRDVPYRLVENGFISSPDDVAVFEARLDDLALGYLAALGIGDGEAPAPQPAPELPSQPVPASTDEFHGGLYNVVVGPLNVRTGPGLGHDVVATYPRGGQIWLDDWYRVADGYVWARYTGVSTGLKRYVAVGPHTGSPDPDRDYLVLA